MTDSMSQFEPTPAPAPADAPPAAEGPPQPDPETGLFVDPRTLESFLRMEQKITKARQAGDRVPEEITSEDQLPALQEALSEIKFAREDVETNRKDEKRPYEMTGRRIDAAFNEMKAAMLALEESLKERLVKFDQKREEEAAAERRAEEEAARKRQQEADAEAAKRGVAARAHKAPAPRKRVTGARSGLGKSSVRKVRKWRVTDLAALPDEYVERVPNKAACAAAAKAGEVVPGLEFYDEAVVATR